MVSAACGPASAPAVEQIAALANVLVIRGPGDPGLAGIPPGTALAADEFALLTQDPRGRRCPGPVRARQDAVTALRPTGSTSAGSTRSCTRIRARRRGAPIPPGQEQLDPGWLLAQRREERRLARPLKAGAAAGAGLAALAGALGAAGVLKSALAGTGIAVSWPSRWRVHEVCGAAGGISAPG